ncbi:unnamed protein product, partial [Didymodactylos carnosus]
MDAYRDGQKMWNEIKGKGPDIIKQEIGRMTTELKAKSSPIHSLWAQNQASSTSSALSTSSVLPSSKEKQKLNDNNMPNGVLPLPPSTSSSVETATILSSVETLSSVFTSERECVKENSVRTELNIVNEQIAALSKLNNTGLWTIENKKDMDILHNKRSNLNKKINRLISNRAAQTRIRKNRKLQMQHLLDNHPEIAKELSGFTHIGVGRPSIEETDPGLLGAIMDIANSGVVAADERRRTDVIRSCLSLDALKEQLNERGFQISRTATYYRLLPKSSRTIDGKKHVHTVPVRIRRPENSRHKYHEDTKFTLSTINDLKTMAAALGDESVFYLSQDDKCRIPMGIPASQKQAPIIMSMKIQIKLPDHDFVVATKHKLIPSVYAACLIKEKRVSFTGPTFVTIRSGKHDHSTAQSHAVDFETLIQLPEFEKAALTNGLLKPVVMISVDGGPDENPRFPKTVHAATNVFQKHNLDALFVVTNAPGRSAFNEVERRMAPLSHELAGLILPYDHYGNHLDSAGKTIDDSLEIRNFERAGETLAEIWSQMKIDGHPVTARYVKPPIDDTTHLEMKEDLVWRSKHVRQSQYLLQVVRCHDLSCCKPWRSYYPHFLNNSFLPPPIAVMMTGPGPIPASTDQNGNFLQLFERQQLNNLIKTKLKLNVIPFDYYCSSVQQDIERRICKHCDLYFPSIAAVNRHKIIHTPIPSYLGVHKL